MLGLVIPNGFPLMQELNPCCSHLVFYERKHFCSVLTDLSNFSFLFHQKFPLLSSDMKNILTKKFPKTQKRPFAMFFRIDVLINFSIFERKYLC